MHFEKGWQCYIINHDRFSWKVSVWRPLNKSLIRYPVCVFISGSMSPNKTPIVSKTIWGSRFLCLQHLFTKLGHASCLRHLFTTAATQCSHCHTGMCVIGLSAFTLSYWCMKRVCVCVVGLSVFTVLLVCEVCVGLSVFTVLLVCEVCVGLSAFTVLLVCVLLACQCSHCPTSVCVVGLSVFTLSYWCMKCVVGLFVFTPSYWCVLLACQCSQSNWCVCWPVSVHCPTGVCVVGLPVHTVLLVCACC